MAVKIEDYNFLRISKDVIDPLDIKNKCADLVQYKVIEQSSKEFDYKSTINNIINEPEKAEAFTLFVSLLRANSISDNSNIDFKESEIGKKLDISPVQIKKILKIKLSYADFDKICVDIGSIDYVTCYFKTLIHFYMKELIEMKFLPLVASLAYDDKKYQNQIIKESIEGKGVYINPDLSGFTRIHSKTKNRAIISIVMEKLNLKMTTKLHSLLEAYFGNSQKKILIIFRKCINSAIVVPPEVSNKRLIEVLFLIHSPITDKIDGKIILTEVQVTDKGIESYDKYKESFIRDLFRHRSAYIRK